MITENKHSHDWPFGYNTDTEKSEDPQLLFPTTMFPGTIYIKPSMQ